MLIILQYCSGFFPIHWHESDMGDMCSPSWTPLPTPTQYQPWAPYLMHQTWTGDQNRSNFNCRSNTYVWHCQALFISLIEMTSKSRTNDFQVVDRINSLIWTNGKLPPVNWAYVHALIKSTTESCWNSFYFILIANNSNFKISVWFLCIFVYVILEE